jgi:hypothetical protein
MPGAFDWFDPKLFTRSPLPVPGYNPIGGVLGNTGNAIGAGMGAMGSGLGNAFSGLGTNVQQSGAANLAQTLGIGPAPWSQPSVVTQPSSATPAGGGMYQPAQGSGGAPSQARGTAPAGPAGPDRGPQGTQDRRAQYFSDFSTEGFGRHLASRGLNPYNTANPAVKQMMQNANNYLLSAMANIEANPSLLNNPGQAIGDVVQRALSGQGGMLSPGEGKGFLERAQGRAANASNLDANGMPTSMDPLDAFFFDLLGRDNEAAAQFASRALYGSIGGPVASSMQRHYQQMPFWAEQQDAMGPAATGYNAEQARPVNFIDVLKAMGRGF